MQPGDSGVAGTDTPSVATIIKQIVSRAPRPWPQARHPEVEAFELGEYVRALSSSSNNVRFIVFALVILTLVVFAAFRQAQPTGWTNQRANLAAAALRNNVWHRDFDYRLKECLDVTARRTAVVPPEAKQSIAEQVARDWGFFDPCVLVNQAKAFKDRYGLRRPQAAENYLQEIQRVRFDNIIIMKIPLIDTPFDVNELGIFSGIAFMLLMVTLAVAMYRHHENLYLSLWKVRELSREAGGLRRDSKANLLYHALAMTQLFTKPPTLARWQSKWYKNRIPKLLYLAPVIMQMLVFNNDRKTLTFAAMLAPGKTSFGLLIQVVSLLTMLVTTGLCLLLSSAGDREWSKTFLAINPSFRSLRQPSFLRWLTGQVPVGWGVEIKKRGETEEVFFADTKSGVVWRFTKDQKLDVVVRKRALQLFEASEGKLFGDEYSGGRWGKRLLGLWTWDGEDVKELSPPDLHEKGAGVVQDSTGRSWSFAKFDCGLYARDAADKEAVLVAGGALRESVDGNTTLAGFEGITGMAVAPNDVLYLVDGVSVRKMTPEGEVTTLGGQPLGGDGHCWRHRLLGVAFHDDCAYVADYDRGCVWKVPANGGGRESKWPSDDFWEQRLWWSPTGLKHGTGGWYVLEYRPDTLIGGLLGLIGPWIRVRRISDDGREKELLVTVTYWKRRRARRARTERAPKPSADRLPATD